MPQRYNLFPKPSNNRFGIIKQQEQPINNLDHIFKRIGCDWAVVLANVCPACNRAGAREIV